MSDVNVDGGGARLGRLECRVGDLLGRDRQRLAHLGLREIASDGTGDHGLRHLYLPCGSFQTSRNTVSPSPWSRMSKRQVVLSTRFETSVARRSGSSIEESSGSVSFSAS